MNIQLPSFERGKDFEELSPKDGKNTYRYKTKRCAIVRWSGCVPKGTKISFYDKNGREWLYIDDHHFIIHNHYAWDGCTPKKHIPIFGWVGTPDTEKTILASLIHDVLCQFQDTEHMPLSRYQIDNIFKNILKDKKFIFHDIYYMGVRIGALTHRKNNENYSRISLTAC